MSYTKSLGEATRSSTTSKTSSGGPKAPRRSPSSSCTTIPKLRSPTGMYTVKTYMPAHLVPHMPVHLVTHMPAHLVPHSDTCKFVTVHRDPKEAVASMHPFMSNVIGVPGATTLEEFAEMALADKGFCYYNVMHTASYWKRRHEYVLLLVGCFCIPRRSNLNPRGWATGLKFTQSIHNSYRGPLCDVCAFAQGCIY